jgi:DNA (cytosine-5)-methyltransferase 1
MTQPDLRIGSLCSGYEGLGMAVQAVLGGELAWVADNDPGASAILAHRFPSVPNLGDITTVAWRAIRPVGVFCAGFPCQPASNAGKRLGETDERWIWPAVAGAVRDLRPELVFLENVSALLVRGFAGVIADLAQIGYVGSWCCLRASDAGAPHLRDRVFILALPAPENPYGAAGRQWRPAAPGQAESRGTWPDARGRGGVPAAPARRLSLLPTPAARDWKSGASNLMDQNSRPLNEFAVNMLADVRTPDAQWIAADGTDYGPAIRRWEQVLGRPAPCPTEPGSRGNRRLSAVFAEWMMGLDEGHVTAVPGLDRNAQLHALGNGVVPQQAAMALRLLLDRTDIPSLVAAEDGAA